MAVYNRQIMSESVAYAQQQGLKGWVYTIDDPAFAKAMRELGADGIIANDLTVIQRTFAIRDTSRSK